MTSPDEAVGPRAARVVVRGIVQGVGYRWHVRQAARRAMAGGWIRNCADGSVEALIVGDSHAVDEVIGSMRDGPPGARVDQMDVRPSDPTGAPVTFTIK